MMPEQADLLRKAEASLVAARVLAKEGLLDFAVSRAYYTMFYVVEALLLGEGLAFSRHSGVIAAFGREFTRTGRVSPKFHRYLLDGQDSRSEADYSYKPSMSSVDAETLIEHGQEFLDLAEQLLGPIPPLGPRSPEGE